MQASKLNLSELRGLRQSMLDDATDTGSVDIVFYIAQILAFGNQPRYPYIGSPAPARIREGDYCIHYTKPVIDTPHRAIWGTFEKVIVTMGGKAPFELYDGIQIVRLFRGKPEYKGDNNIPELTEIREGQYWSNVDWSDERGILKRMAGQYENSIMNNRNERERQLLIEQLFIGE